VFSKKILGFFQVESSSDYSEFLDGNVEYCAEGKCLERLGSLDVDLAIFDCADESDVGIDLLKKVKQMHPGIPVIIATGFCSEDFVVNACKSGAT
jgi:DNA-binding NtrC family response regulator